MPIRYFIAMCLVTLLLAGVFLYSLPPEIADDAVSRSQSVATPEPARSPSPTKVGVAPTEERPMTVETAAEAAIPADQAGALAARVLSPETIARPAIPLPAGVSTSSPQSRTLPARFADPGPNDKIVGLSNIPLPTARSLKPVSPAERVPYALAAWAGDPPVRPVLPAAPAVKEKPRDPAQPPVPPVLARPPMTKPSFNDPTTEVGNEAVVNRPLLAELVTAGFVRFGLPDPFVYAEQVRAKLDPASEPGLSPVPVNPRRPK